MSSVKNNDKSLEEIRPLVEQYRENYRKLFGSFPVTSELCQKLEDLKQKKEQEIFHQSFGTLTPKNIADAMSILEGMNTPPIKQKFFQKGKA
jgi:hypothetical protein